MQHADQTSAFRGRKSHSDKVSKRSLEYWIFLRGRHEVACGSLRLRHIVSFSADRDAVLVRRQPQVERLQLGIERARELDAAVAGVEVIEVGPELEHVPDVVAS